MKSIKLLASLLALMTLSLAASCGGGTAGSNAGGSDFSASLDRDNSIAAGSVSLELVPAAGPAGQYSFDIVASGMQDTKALYGVVSYDRSQYSFESAQLAGSAEDTLFLAKPLEDGLNFGMVLANFDVRPGLDGRQAIARVSFSEGSEQLARSIAKAPTGAANAFEIAGSVNENTGQPEISWPEINSGDGDNNGLVTLSDLTPLGISLNTTGVTPGSQADKADYDRNGSVTISDLTPLGINLGTGLAGYAILSGASEGSLTELVRVNRADEFPSPKTTDGLLSWNWVGDVLEEDTFFAVQYFDNAGALGSRSTNVLFLQAVTAAPVLSNVNISLPASPTLEVDGSRSIVYITEASVDEVLGNAEEFAPEMLGLTATAESDADPGNPFDATEQLIWTVPTGGNSAAVSDSAGTKGQLSFRNRGLVTVRAHAPGNNLQFDEVSFLLLSIEDINIELSGGGTGPISVNAGDDVVFSAMGTFQLEILDGGGTVQETITRDVDLTDWAAWAVIPDGANAGTSSFDSGSATLATTDLSSGDQVSVVAEFSPGESVTIFDLAKRVSNIVEINVN
ncbi:hypothetical protein KDL29_14100 [bacterium]|nr:hypothetical protein [bacterium]